MRSFKQLLRACVAGLAIALAAPVSAPVFAADPTPYSWATIPFGGGGFVDGFLYHPKQAGILYARTDIGGMYRYDYSNQSWIPLLDHLGHDDGALMGVLSLAIDPNAPNKIYAATGEYLGPWARNGAILRSDDQGKTWQKTDLPIKVGGNADGRGTGDRLQVDPNRGDILFYGSNQDGLWKSTDGGKTFAKTASPGTALSLVVFDPTSAQAGGASQTLYVGSFDNRGGLFVSHDGGASFAAVSGLPNQVPQHAVFGADGTLYVTFAQGDGKSPVNPSYATTGSVWKLSRDGKGSQITPQRPDGSVTFGYSGIDIDPKGRLVVSTLDRWGGGDDIYQSADGGAHWQALGALSRHDASAYPWLRNYLGGQDKMGHWIADVKLNPFNPDEMVYGTGYGLWMSENLTEAGSKPVRFGFNVKNLEEAATIQMTSPTGGAVVMAAFGDIGGGAWDNITVTPEAGLFVPTTENNYSVDYAGLAPDFVARTVNNSTNNGFYSQDGGASWTRFGSSPYKRQDAKGEWHSPGVVVVSAKGTSMLWAPEKQAAFYSLDKGTTWKESAGWPAGRDMALKPISDKALDGVYYVYDRDANTILISTDHGASFKPLVTGLARIEGWQGVQLAVVPGRMRDLWLAAPYGLVHSPSSDRPAKAVPGVDVAWQVGFGKSATAGGYPAVYIWGKVRGKEGLFRSDDEGQSWVRINDDAHQFGGMAGIAGDMLEYGTLYIAPHGRGLMVGKK